MRQTRTRGIYFPPRISALLPGRSALRRGWLCCAAAGTQLQRTQQQQPHRAARTARTRDWHADDAWRSGSSSRAVRLTGACRATKQPRLSKPMRRLRLLQSGAALAAGRLARRRPCSKPGSRGCDTLPRRSQRAAGAQIPQHAAIPQRSSVLQVWDDNRASGQAKSPGLSCLRTTKRRSSSSWCAKLFELPARSALTTGPAPALCWL
jgi:hypothetical protein